MKKWVLHHYWIMKPELRNDSPKEGNHMDLGILCKNWRANIGAQLPE